MTVGSAQQLFEQRASTGERVKARVFQEALRVAANQALDDAGLASKPEVRSSAISVACDVCLLAGCDGGTGGWRCCCWRLCIPWCQCTQALEAFSSTTLQRVLTAVELTDTASLTRRAQVKAKYRIVAATSLRHNYVYAVVLSLAMHYPSPTPLTPAEKDGRPDTHQFCMPAPLSILKRWMRSFCVCWRSERSVMSECARSVA